MSWEPPFSTGTESAEPAGLRRLLGADPKRLLLPAVVAGVAALSLAPGGDDPRPQKPLRAVATPAATPVPTLEEAGALGTPVDVAEPPRVDAGYEARAADAQGAVYSIYMYKLPGLAPDAEPGTVLDIWVTWKPPLTRAPKVDLLLDDVQLQRIETGFVEGPVADLLVDEEDMPRLIYGERFGSLNVTTSTT